MLDALELVVVVISIRVGCGLAVLFQINLKSDVNRKKRQIVKFIF